MRPPEDDEAPLSSHSYVLATLAALWDNLPQLVAAGLLFSVAAAPALLLLVAGLVWPALIGAIAGAMPGWVALLWFAGRRLDGRADGLVTIFPAFGRLWSRSVRLGLVGLGLPALLLWAAGQMTAAAPELAWLGYVALPPAILLLAVVVIYAAPLLAIHDISAGTALRNAAILSARYLAHTVGLVAMAVLMVLATVYFSLGLIFILPAPYGMFVANNCRLVVKMEEEA